MTEMHLASSAPRPCIVVAGMPRCGTSLMMQALDAMGVPCVGKWPDFETDASSMTLFDPKAFASLSDAAIKLIDPANLPPFTLPNHLILWMKRDFRQQARSQAKLLRAAGIPLLAPTGKVVRAIERSLIDGERKHQTAAGVLGNRSVASAVVPFEMLLKNPRSVMAFVTAFLSGHGWPGLDPVRGAGEVIQRGPLCFDGMLEAEMLARGRRKVAT